MPPRINFSFRMPRAHDPRHDDIEAWAESERAAAHARFSPAQTATYAILGIAVSLILAAALVRLL
jgi:hypothetical protein